MKTAKNIPSQYLSS